MFQLAWGGRDFFNDNVKKGHFFKQNVRDCNHIFFDKQCLMQKFNQLKVVVKTGGNLPKKLASAAAQQEEEKKGMEQVGKGASTKVATTGATKRQGTSKLRLFHNMVLTIDSEEVLSLEDLEDVMVSHMREN